MGDVDESARIEKSENARVIKASGVCRTVLDLEAEPESVSARVRQETRQMVYLGPIKRRTGASGVGDDEGVLGEGTQDSPGILEESECPITGVCDGSCNLQVLQSIDISVGGRGLEGQARDSGDGDCRGDEGDNVSTERGREHRNLCGEG